MSEGQSMGKTRIVSEFYCPHVDTEEWDVCACDKGYTKKTIIESAREELA